jgi:hydrogenase nickel incorporation protein HypB
MISTTEGDDKPGKYPKMFRTSQAMVISKTDLLPYVPFSPERVMEDARRIQGELVVFKLSALHRTGIDDWCRWLEAQRARLIESAVSDGRTS